ncbi:endonuclease/exonuclease/phosphatase family protein [Acinetobacter pittii]|uniref:endonuclease/exonuclease/phosphatase family protein n=1 Tax=Acinetobacter pittii TaxID=48296 RepID=UPI003A8758F4
MQTIENDLKIIWWNVNLSPPASAGRNRASEDKKNQVVEIVESFMKQDYDYICLSEVSLQDIQFFENKIHENGYNFTKVVEHIGSNRYFDTCIIFKNHNEIIKVDGKDCFYDLYQWDTSMLKIGQIYQFIDLKLDEPLIFCVSHWPSLLRNNESEINQISMKLRDWVIKYPNCYVILVGDYNQEPYSDYIVENLQVSRERDYVINNPQILYNPCWKLLVNASEVKGTIKSNQSRFRDWSILDQVMVSSSFLTNKWNFSDEDLSILDDDVLGVMTQNSISQNPSDHYPLSFKFIQVN